MDTRSDRLVDVTRSSGITPAPLTWDERVRALRAWLGLTQVELAEAMNVSFATVNRWENGKTSPSPLAMSLIERAERIGMDAFRAMAEPPPQAELPARE